MTQPILRLITLFTLLFSISLSTNSLAMTNLKYENDSVASYKGKGKWLIVQAWVSTCSICNKEMPAFVKAVPSFKNARVIGISLDKNRAAAQGFINKHNIKFPTLFSNNYEFNKYLNKVAEEDLRGTPTFLIFDPQGNLKALQPGNVSPASIKNFLTKKQ